MSIQIKDIVILKDGRRAIVHEIYSEGNALLVEIVNPNTPISFFPLISTKLVKMVIKAEVDKKDGSTIRKSTC